MMKLSQMKVSRRLDLGFGVLLLQLALIVAIGVHLMGEVNTRLNSISNVNNVETQLAVALHASLYEQSLVTRDLLLAPDRATRNLFSERLKDEIVNYQNIEKKLDVMFNSLEETADIEKATMAQVITLSTSAAPILKKLIELVDADDMTGARRLQVDSLSAKQALRRTKLNELTKLEERLNKVASEDATSFYVTAKHSMIMLGGLALTLGIALALAISRGLVGQLGGEPAYATDIANRIATGNLSGEIRVGSKQASLLGAIKSMSGNLKVIVSEVRSGTDAMVTATSEIATGNFDLSARTEQQAGALEETAAAIEELTAAIRKNAEHTAQASQLANSASGIAENAGQAITRMINTMNAIDSSSKQIVNIINVIDTISFQTNILALNAAVEAARAGEQGRGFAVVASEVRSLAQRSTAAAREIKTLIEESVTNVNNGYQLVQQTGGTMDGVVESIRKVSEVVAEITAAGRDQASGIQQIADAIVQMDQTTQQNAALVEQAAAAASTLQDQARRLQQSVSVFLLKPQA
ncbi:methyl-accepting chemotaxis protein [Herbaspirillum sp. alder98]|uniref:methyl-accepting chemotaxis protein n=1 Tax=Herbaspirillum sp. alder98 TaxID=2913096 RepID=UPI001CD84B69|nr:methyl-accepting chemotaxis protein [Herbaspirillum sp. alder98]MCA1325287.1 methyl-accepting chemotaxis protein [Herbaspirillum sp. alder98]